MIPYFSQLDHLQPDQCGIWLAEHTPLHLIACNNWQEDFPYTPLTRFAIARSSTALVVHYACHDRELMALNTAPLGPVANENCVEIFLSLPGSDEYWNFEFNAIGTVNASHRRERPNPTRLTPQQIATIIRCPSLGTQPIALHEGDFHWTLTVTIPFALIGVDPQCPPPYLKANLYKCGAKLPTPHYLSWQPIDSDRPDFHRPDCFGRLQFE